MGEQKIGEKIRDARKQAGLTQCQLANKIFVSESYIALIESGRRNPRMNVLAKLAEVLHLTTDHIVFDTSARTTDSFTLEWQKLTENRSPEEIKTALKMLQAYFECIDSL